MNKKKPTQEEMLDNAEEPKLATAEGSKAASSLNISELKELTISELAHIAKDCGMKGLISDRSKLATMADTLCDIPSLEFLVVSECDEFSACALPTHAFADL